MNCLRLPLLGSKTLIQAAIIPSFICVLRCHTRYPKGKVQNLISSNSVAFFYLPACWLANPNLHRLIMPILMSTPTIPKRIYLIFLWAEFPQRDPIPIIDPLLKTVYIFVGIWGAHSYLDSKKYNKTTDNFINHPPIFVPTY